MYSVFTKILILLLLFLINVPLYSTLATEKKTRKTVTVLLSADTSGLNLTIALQYTLAQLFKQTELFSVQLSSYLLQGFTASDISLAHQLLVSDILSFAYLEKEQVSIFLFDKEFDGRFFVATEPLFSGEMTKITKGDIERKLQATFVTLMKVYRNKECQYLPGASAKLELVESEEEQKKRRLMEAKQIFSEFAAQEYHPLYLGANIGMVRFGESRPMNVVNVGASIGYWLGKSFSVEMNANMFTYLIASLMLKYRIPLPNNFIYLTTAMSVGNVISSITENRGIASTLKVGSTLLGPTLSIEVPLLGANVRAEVSFLVGNGFIFIGNYGVTYSIKL